MKEELSFDERKEWARTLYIHNEKTIKDAALEAGVDEASVRQWVHDGAWEGQRRSQLLTKKAMVDRYLSFLEKVDGKLKLGEEPNAKDLDAYVKCSAAIKNLEVEPTVSTIIETTDLFIQWLRRKDRQLTRKFVVLFDAFIKQRIQY